MSNVTIGNFDFGDVDGKKESQAENFESLFYSKDSYVEELVNNSVFIIMGRKGVGKTILAEFFKKTCDKKKTSNCKILDISDFIELKLKSFNVNKISVEEMDVFWKYVLILEIGSQIIEKASWRERKFSKRFRNLSNYIANKQFDLVEYSTKDYAKISQSFSTSSAGVGGEMTIEDSRKYQSSNYYEGIKELNQLVKAAMKKGKQYFIIYDDVDELADKVEDKDYFYKMMNSLIRASAKVNNDFQESGKVAKVILAFRKDIIDALQVNSSNLNKIISSDAIYVNWFSSQKDEKEHPITKMLIHKMRASESAYEKLSDEAIYDKVFGQKSGHKTIIGFLIDNSFGRPRDIVKFMNIYKKNFSSDGRIEYKKLKDCLREYSIWFYQELNNELNIHKMKEELIETIVLIKKYGQPVFCKTFLHNIAKKKYTPLRLKFFSDYFGLDRAFLSRKLSPVKLKMCA